MAYRGFSILAFCLISTLIAGCATTPRPDSSVVNGYDLQTVSVTASDQVSPGLVAALGQQMQATVLDNYRQSSSPNATMDVHIISSVTHPAIDMLSTQTDFTVATASIQRGYPLSIQNVTVFSKAIAPQSVDAMASEAIARHLRILFHLRQPSIVAAPVKLAEISTRTHAVALVSKDAASPCPQGNSCP